MAGFFSLYVQFSLFIGIQPGDYIEQCGLAAVKIRDKLIRIWESKSVVYRCVGEKGRVFF